MPRIVTATRVARFLSTRKRAYQTTVFVAGMSHDFQVFSQLIGYSPTLFVWSKSYTPNNLSGKYFKLVETFLIVVVSQNVFSPEIDNPFFYKVFQLAPGGGGFASGGIPHN